MQHAAREKRRVPLFSKTEATWRDARIYTLGLGIADAVLCAWRLNVLAACARALLAPAAPAHSFGESPGSFWTISSSWASNKFVKFQRVWLYCHTLKCRMTAVIAFCDRSSRRAAVPKRPQWGHAGIMLIGHHVTSQALHQEWSPLYTDMATACERLDDLVKDYLLFRGFTATVKALDHEVKHDKDKGLRVWGR